MTNLAASLNGRRFRVISADPAWRYKGYASDGVPQRAKEQHYKTMSLEQLKALPVRMHAEKDAILFMWVISSHIDQAIELGEAWGFKFKTIGFWWDKGKMSLGKWTRQEGEICLLFSRGKPTRSPGAGGVRQTIREKPREHSRKPEEALIRMEKLCRGPYLELFSRSTRPGWVAWGDQADLFAARPGSP